MSTNPVARIRLWGNAVLIAVVVFTFGGMMFTQTYWESSPWLVVSVALGYAALSFVSHLRHPDKVEAAWDEQNTAAHRASLVFGYWAMLAVFLLLLVAVLTKQIDGSVAFFWLGPVLGFGPSVHYLVSVARGRAE